VSNLIDMAGVPVIDVWGEAVRARRIEGERITLALIELAPDAIVPGHRHENEQLGMVITGSLTLTVGDETRQLGPGGTGGSVRHAAPGQRRTDAAIVDIFAPTRAIGTRPASRPARVWPMSD
jgi:hypothetical protein